MTYLAAAIQMNAGADKPANLERAERLIRVGAARGANLVALPEVFNWRGKRNEQAAAAETLDGQTLTLMSSLGARAANPHRRGSITEQVAGESRCYNTSVLLGPEGGRIAVYRKIHLFDVDLPGRVTCASPTPSSRATTSSSQRRRLAPSTQHLLRPALP